MLRCIRRRVLWQSSSIISPSHHCSHLRRSWRWRGNYISIIGRVTIRFAVFLRLISIRSTPCSRRPDNLWLPSRVQNGPSCPRDQPAAASRVQRAPSCPRDQPAAASRVQKAPSCPRDLPDVASRVQIGLLCPRGLPDVASRVQIGPLCPRERPAAAANTSPADFILVIREFLLSLCPC